MKIPTTLWIVIKLTRSNIRVSVSSSPGSQWPGSSPSQVLATMALAIMELMLLSDHDHQEGHNGHRRNHHNHGYHYDHNGYRDDLKIVQFRKEISNI